MTIRISDTPLPRDRLPALISESLEALLGKRYRVLDPSPPWAESAIFALDGKNRPVLVQYDPDDGGHALLAGLATLDKLERQIHWLTRSYSEFSKGRPLVQPDLVTVSPTPPAGAIRLCRESAWLRCFTFRPLRVDDEIGLLLEPVGPDALDRPDRAVGTSNRELNDRTPGPEAPVAESAAVAGTTASDPASPIEAGLSGEEEEFFEHL
jgi:hypothetical protein